MYLPFQIMSDQTFLCSAIFGTCVVLLSRGGAAPLDRPRRDKQEEIRAVNQHQVCRGVEQPGSSSGS
jgi:hypothetical protein